MKFVCQWDSLSLKIQILTGKILLSIMTNYRLRLKNGFLNLDMLHMYMYLKTYIQSLDLLWYIGCIIDSSYVQCFLPAFLFGMIPVFLLKELLI